MRETGEKPKGLWEIHTETQNAFHLWSNQSREKTNETNEKTNNTRKLYLSSSTVAVTETKPKERVICLR